MQHCLGTAQAPLSAAVLGMRAAAAAPAASLLLHLLNWACSADAGPCVPPAIRSTCCQQHTDPARAEVRTEAKAWADVGTEARAKTE